MKNIKLISGLCAVLISSSVQANEPDKEVCLYYGNVGAAAVDFLMPLSLRQIVDMISGKDAALTKKMSQDIEGIGSSLAKKRMTEMGNDAAEHLGASAGFQAFQLIMTAQVTSPQEVFSVLYRSCSATGPMKIVENQRNAVREAAAPPEAQ